MAQLSPIKHEILRGESRTRSFVMNAAVEERSFNATSARSLFISNALATSMICQEVHGIVHGISAPVVVLKQKLLPQQDITA